MARKKKLRPGKGAIAEILTRFINPKQPIPGHDIKKHRSMVVLEEEDKDDNQKKIFRFYYDGDESKSLMWANHRYCNVLKEGDHLMLFGGPGEPRPPDSDEPKIKWRFSKARRLLVDDVNAGIIKFDHNDEPLMDVKDIYAMHVEYADYLFELFEERLLAIWKKTKDDINRAEEDLKHFEEFLENNEVSYFNKDGFIHWQGSEAQEQALVDLEANNIRDYGYLYVFQNNPVYHENFSYEQFKACIKQEVRTAKYLHTVEVRDLQKKEKRNKKKQSKKTTTNKP